MLTCIFGTQLKDLDTELQMSVYMVIAILHSRRPPLYPQRSNVCCRLLQVTPRHIAAVAEDGYAPQHEVQDLQVIILVI